MVLPVAARATASTAIKSNIRLTEVLVEPSICINRQKAVAIINMHMGMRMQERWMLYTLPLIQTHMVDELDGKGSGLSDSRDSDQRAVLHSPAMASYK
uniref:Uncharacterized protein n=1 Tax=Pavo cristatus TaxID=9049 RepID=A0A8C9G4R5_PAVCR